MQLLICLSVLKFQLAPLFRLVEEVTQVWNVVYFVPYSFYFSQKTEIVGEIPKITVSLREPADTKNQINDR